MFWWPFVMTFSNNRLTVSYRSRYNTLTFTIPLHRSVHNQSSEWSVDNSSLGQQNVSWTVDHIQWESKMHERANFIHYHKHSSMQHMNYRENEHVQSFFLPRRVSFPAVIETHILSCFGTKKCRGFRGSYIIRCHTDILPHVGTIRREYGQIDIVGRFDHLHMTR